MARDGVLRPLLPLLWALGSEAPSLLTPHAHAQLLQVCVFALSRIPHFPFVDEPPGSTPSATRSRSSDPQTSFNSDRGSDSKSNPQSSPRSPGPLTDGTAALAGVAEKASMFESLPSLASTLLYLLRHLPADVRRRTEWRSPRRRTRWINPANSQRNIFASMKPYRSLSKPRHLMFHVL